MESLGHRDIAIAYDWSPHIDRYPNLLATRHPYCKQFKSVYIAQPEEEMSDAEFAKLNPEQRLVFNLFTQHCRDTIDPDIDSPLPLRVQVDGQGGTGKYFLIKAF